VGNDWTLQRRVSRLENEVESIYELIDDFRAEFRRRLDQIDRTLSNHHTRFDQIDTRLATHDTRFDRIDSTLTEVLRRLPEAS
jgi:chromosome segregation ATPase